MKASNSSFSPPTRADPNSDRADALENLISTSSEEALRFLAEFSVELASCLDHAQALRRIATLAVPRLADLCTIDLVDQEGRLERLGLAHRNPERVALLAELGRRYPPYPDAAHGPVHVLRTGRPEHVRHFDDETLRETAQDDRHLRLLRQLQMHSYVGVPLIARGRTIGVLSLATAESGREYGEPDLELALDLAGRAALAVDNAQLYQSMQFELAQRKQAEALARESEARMQFALEAAQVGTWDWDFRSGAVSWCENMASMHALGPNGPRHTIDDFQATIHPEDRERVMAQLQESLAGGAEFRVEYRLAPGPSRERWVSARGRGVLDEQQQPLRIGGVCMDITDRIEAERERTRLAAIVNSSQDAIIGQDLSGRITSWNAGAQRIYGYSAQEALGRSIALLMSEALYVGFAAVLERLAQGEKIELVEAVHRHKDGHAIPVSLSCAPVVNRQGDVVATSVIARDISEVKRLNRDLQRKLEEMQTLLDVAPVGIAVAHDPDAALITVNPAGARLRGIDHRRDASLTDPTGEELPFRAVCEGRRVPPEQLPMQFAMANRTVVDGAELDIVHRDGRVHTLYEYASPLYDENGDVRGGLGVFIDITPIKNVEAALRESRERLLAALLASGTGTFRWDIPSGQLDWDDNLRELFGVEPGREAEHGIEELVARVHPEDRQMTAERIRQIARSGEDLDLQLRVPLPNGRERWIACKGKTVFDERTGRPMYVTGAGVDVTERKHSEQALRSSEERFRMALMGSPILVFAHDTELRYTWVHNAALRPFTQVLGKRDDELLENETHGRRLVNFKKRVLVSGKGNRRELALKFRGKLYFFDMTVEPRRDSSGRIIGLIGAAVDITERRRLEAQLRRQARLLRQADIRKDQFLAMLAHELRNPLAPIRNAVRLLKLQQETPDPTLQWAGDVIERQVDQMSRLVDDLLDVARITQGRITLKRAPVDLDDVITRAVETVAPQIEEYGHQLTVSLPETPIWLEADQPRLAQVLANLLNNAIKYTEPGGEIELRARREENTAEIRIRDTGVGIAPELLPHIFDLFSQADRSLDRSQGGLGLGLTLVRNLVEMHGGDVTARSAGDDQGSEFIVHLPCLAERPSIADPELVHTGTEQAARRVLVVDDNHDVAISFACLLSSLGHEVQTVYSGADALVAADRFAPQLIFLDIGLPGLDGYETARRLRKKHPPETVSLVALTGYGDEETHRRCREVGFDHYLLKPGDLSVITRLLAQAPCLIPDRTDKSPLSD